MSEIKPSPRWLRPVVEYGPVIAFFIAFKMYDLIVATAAIMAATALALVLSYIVERRIPKMPLITAGVIGVFGGLTLWLQDDTFIKMKPTIIQSIFGTALIGGLVAKRLFLKSLMGSALHMTDKGWQVLTIRLGLFFYFSAALNEVVWRTQSTDFWVNFKVFGIMGLTILFIFSQMASLKQFAVEPPLDSQNRS